MSPVENLERFVDEDVSVAAVNAPGFAVLSGPDAAVERLEKGLEQERVPVRRLHTSHAFHSSMMDPILEPFEDAVSRVKLSYREFYNDVTRRLEQSGFGAASFFLNYGYVSLGEGDEAQLEVPGGVFNRNSVRLALELIGRTELGGNRSGFFA
jgi:hypothetical protein